MHPRSQAQDKAESKQPFASSLWSLTKPCLLPAFPLGHQWKGIIVTQSNTQWLLLPAKLGYRFCVVSDQTKCNKIILICWVSLILTPFPLFVLVSFSVCLAINPGGFCQNILSYCDCVCQHTAQQPQLIEDHGGESFASPKPLGVSWCFVSLWKEPGQSILHNRYLHQGISFPSKF